MSACDLCHARKIKCDRLDPCQSCLLAKVACRRSRTRRVRHPDAHADGGATLRDRVARLEDVLRRQTLPTGRRSVTNANVTSNTQDNGPQRIGNNRSLQKIPSPREPSTPSPSSSLPENNARAFIQKELSSGPHLSSRQRMTLEASLSLVEKLSQASYCDAESAGLRNGIQAQELRLTHAEILHIIMASKSYETDTLRPGWLVQFPDFLSAEVIERMGLALLSNTLDEQIALQYRIVLLFKGAIIYHIHQIVELKAHAELGRHLNDVMVQRLHAALGAIDELRLLTPPSLSLLQALLCGALIMRMLGDSMGCWTIIASASRTLVALGYHNITELRSDSLMDEEALPPLQIPVKSLIISSTSRSEDNLTPLFLELAQAQETALKLIAVSDQHPNAWLIAGINSIRRDMIQLYRKILNGGRSQDIQQPPIVLPWKVLQLNFCSVMASILRLSPDMAYNRQLQDECVFWAREALRTLLSLHFSGPERCKHLYISWSLSSYPLCPIFIIFCNIIRTGNAQDFSLLKRLNTDLVSLPGTNILINRLRNLHTTLVKLCEPLVHHPPDPGSVPPVAPQGTSSSTSRDIGEPQGFSTQPANDSPGGNQNMNDPTVVNSVAQDLGPDLYGSFFDEDMMGRLFSSKPSVEWFNADALDFVMDFDL